MRICHADADGICTETSMSPPHLWLCWGGGGGGGGGGDITTVNFYNMSPRNQKELLFGHFAPLLSTNFVTPVQLHM